VFYGDATGGRLSIPESIFFNNPNDLATQLVFSGALLLYLIRSSNWFARIFGLVLITATVLAITKTGSRGLFLALAACALATFVLSRSKIKLLLVALPITVLALVTLPSETRNRLVYIVLTDESAPVTEDGDYGSQMQRIALVEKAVELTLKNPIFGVGPAMFPEAVWAESKLTGTPTPFLNTHNGYVQVSSEAGFPGLVAFVAVLLLTVKMSYRLLRRTRDDPGLLDVNAMAFALLVASIGFAVASMFHHLAYTQHLPILAGMTLAVWEAAAPLIDRPKPAATGGMRGSPVLALGRRP
jgi:O-antigen ligase